MKSPLPTLLTFAALIAAHAAIAAGSDDAANLTWQELSRRPELWPAQCTLQHSLKFQDGASVQAGQKMKILEIKANEADVGTMDDKTNFALEPDETDVLALARDAYVKLTPKQRALTYAVVAQQRELWPAQIVLTKTIPLGGGAAVHEGERLPVVEIRADRLLVKSEALHGTVNLAPSTTDLMTQARQFVEDPQAGPRFNVVQKQLAEGKRIADEKLALLRVFTELEGKLVNSVTGKPEPLDPSPKPRYIVFYRGSSTCSITRAFTPKLIRYYQQMKPRHPEFEIVWMMTESPEDTGKFARELGFSWRAITYDDEAKLYSINNAISGKLPQLIVVDPSGKILANGWQDSAPAALKQLDALLKQPTGQM
jgi:hypothetical protein